MLRLQHVYGGARGPDVNANARGSEPRQRGRGGRRQDVVDAELDLRLRFPPNRVGGRGVGVGPHRGAECGVWSGRGRGWRRRWRRRWSELPAAVGLGSGEGWFAWVPEADLDVPAAAATPEVSVLKQVQHGLTARGEGPEVPLALFVTLRPWNLVIAEQPHL